MGRELSIKGVSELNLFSGTPTSSDMIPILDHSTDEVKRIEATKVAFAGGEAFTGVPASGDDFYIFDDSASAVKEIDARKIPVQGASAFSGAAAATDELLVYDASASAFATVGLQDIAINQAFGTNIFTNANVKHHVVTATLAEINAGHDILTGVSGATIHLIDVAAVVNGTFATGTDVRIQDDTGNVALTYAQAGLSDGAIIRTSEMFATEGAAFAVGFTAGDSVRVIKTGSDFTGGTDITFSILYSIQ